MSLGIETIETRQYEDGFVGAEPRKSIDVTIAIGQTIKRFCPLARQTEDGKYYKWNPVAEDGTEIDDGTEIFRGILLGNKDVDTTTAECKAELCIVGEFDADFVSEAWGETVPPEAYAFGNIILRKVAK